MTYRYAMARVLLIAVIMFSLVSALFAVPAKYVFLMIGDGMGEAQRAAAERFLGAQVPDGAGDKALLVMNRLPVRGVTTTHPVGGGVTDSAASGTALACGEKTHNNVIGLAADKKTHLVSVAQKVKAAGLAVGIVSSVSLDHATPAAFYAHVPNRNQCRDIAMQFAAADVDYFGGGQLAGDRDGHRKLRKGVAPQGGPLARAVENGFTLVTNRAGLAGCGAQQGKIYAFGEKVDKKAALPYAIDQELGEPALVDFMRAGIEVVKDAKGFFMMVEGGRIDWAGHANDIAPCVREVIDFDRAVAVAVAFYRKHPKDTLVVVTADHETGGLRLEPESKANDLRPMKAQSSSRLIFEGELQKFAIAAGSWEAVLAEVQKRFRFGDLSPKEISHLRAAYAALVPSDGERKRAPSIARVCTDLVAERAGMRWTTGGHSGVSVPTTAIGVGAAAFGGEYDNTDIPKRILAAMGLE
ncbi:MAG: alkaline phosphatase [Kiritimatiellae bacterium]|nr:alkaline phosphatase [Kiritimatiellia bacterium]